ncbi:MAG: hypothetical protein K8W52_10365 [Deltaproteobacteria bacterium]|nr:hypothetical protein [Deltaproteobacteria bacterium]
MMIDPTYMITEPATDHPYRTAAAPRAVDPDAARVPYDGQPRMRLAIASGLADARIVIDPAARDLLAIVGGDHPRPRIHLADGELALRWRRSLGDWLREVLTPGTGDLAIILHPAVEWTLAIRGGLSGVELELAAGAVARIEIGGGCSHVMLDLPRPAAVAPIRIAGGASHLGIRRPAEIGVGLGVAGGIARLRLDDQSLEAVGGAAQLASGDVSPGAPQYAVAIAGGVSDLVVARRAHDPGLAPAFDVRPPLL